MKKGVPFFLLILSFLFLIIVIPKGNTVFAEDTEADDTEENLDDAVNDTLDGLDLTGFDELLTLLNEYNDVTVANSIRTLVNDILAGKSEFDFSYFAKFCTEIVLGETVNILPQLLLIALFAFLYSVLQNLNSGFSSSSTQKILYLACFGLVVTVIGAMTAKNITSAVKTFEFMGKFSEVSFPILITLVTALGGSASAAVYQPMILIFGNVLIVLIKTVIMPLFYITFVFSIVGHLSENVKLDKFSKTVKSAAEWITGIAFGTFVTLLTSQGITGAGLDNLAIRGAKFALSSYVPIIGNYLKDGFDIVLAGCIVVKNALGLCAILILLFAVLIPLLKTVILMLGLKFTAAVLQPLSDEKFSSLLYVVADSFKILIVAVLCAAFAALLIVMMIIYTCNFGVI